MGFVAITWGGTVHEHHSVEATYLRLFETVGNGLGLSQRCLKMVSGGFPLMRRCRRNTRDRMREAEDLPKRHRSSVDQLTSMRIKLRSLRMLAEDDEALNHEREHRPRTAGVRSAATWQPPALFVKD